MHWTPDQVKQLAPDTATAQKGQDLASTRYWRGLSGNQHALWGECKGSGSRYYSVQIDLHRPAFKCNCPSRKRPCKHALGLFLMYLSHTDGFRVTEDMPQTLIDWLEKGSVKPPEPDKEPQAAPSLSPQRSKRLEEMAAGLSDLENWLEDLMRQGLADTEQQDYSFWQDIAARMVDMKLGGIARRLRQLPLLQGGQLDWPDKILTELGAIYMVARGFEQLEKLPPALQQSLLSVAGIYRKKDDLLKGKGLVDDWLVLGQIEGAEDNLRFRRVWLQGQQEGRMALLLDFVHNSMDFEGTWANGALYRADVVYYPAAFPLRALIRQKEKRTDQTAQIEGFTLFTELLEGFAKALARDPWLLDFPAVLLDVWPAFEGEKLYLIDQEQKCIPVLSRGLADWKLIALSGGNPISLFGEWTGQFFVPLSLWAEGGPIDLSRA
ncbi:MAG: SWIM zinc finger family protein [Bacteroidota bacterium]